MFSIFLVILVVALQTSVAIGFKVKDVTLPFFCVCVCVFCRTNQAVSQKLILTNSAHRNSHAVNLGLSCLETLLFMWPSTPFPPTSTSIHPTSQSSNPL